MKSRKKVSRLRYYLGLILIIGAMAALALQFRSARILSYDMLPPDTGFHPIQNSNQAG
ncbi:MAG: hypothetical protein M3Q07_21560 [Pseudobdellovibrionaceae bacterium]|nr:hypothetical protein [Pseudobdellovibrionaceae bacterium]